MSFFHGATAPTGSGSLSRLHDDTQTYTLGRTPIGEWQARRRDFYLTTHNICKGQTSMPPAGFEPAIQASERLQTHALDLEATGIWTTFFFLWRCGPTRAMASSFLRFLDHTQRRITDCRTPLDEWSARRRDLYLTTHITLTTDRHPCPRWDLNPRFQQASGRRPTP